MPQTTSEICEKLVNFLKLHQPKDKNNKITCNPCDLLNYWLGDQLNSIFPDQCENNSKIIELFKFMWKKILEEVEYPQEKKC
ncbi:PIR Superfamily Protein [Plasmodium ovale curtisi]|uniref:PIR Superfamily Protein n=1 Tax=Plasmodium ovale curtisi TaxID=864141 RepID=A0A1A8WM20_PLAOA|nr:PIR Superfamily Protein [Plasmodium ovale curtisi]